MNRIARTALYAALAVALVGAGVIVGRRTDETNPQPAAAAGDASRPILYYRAPMSADTSPVPKKDPMGMDYVPVYADEGASAPGTVRIDAARLQALGVRSEPVRRGPVQAAVRTSASIAYDETRLFVVAPRFAGWVAHLHANQTGMPIRPGQPLMAVYSPELAAAREEIRLADSAARRLAGTDPEGAAAMRRLREAAVRRLRNWEVDAAGTGSNVVFRSRVGGVLIEKPVLPGARFEAGEPLMRVADLSTVWAIAYVPVAQAPDLKVGQRATFESPALPGRTLEGRITFIQPTVDAKARTVDVRVELPNPGRELRPGLFGSIALSGPAVQALTVPASAVIDSGTRTIALVEAGAGRFAPREVATGRRFGDRVEIVAGLAEGERVVTAANFLIDAESNLQSALQGLAGHAGHGGAAPAGEPAATPPAAPDAAPAAGHEGH